MAPDDKLLKDLNKSVKQRLNSITGNEETEDAKLDPGSNQQRFYKDFKQEEREATMLESLFERYCDFAYNILNFIKVGDKSSKQMLENLEVSGLKANPSSITAATIFSFLFSLLVSVPSLIIGWRDFSLFIMAVGLFVAYVVYTYPGFASQTTKIQAQQESLLAVVYITIYMRVNPILENAVYFATQHLAGPLGKDLKYCLWLVETEKTATIEEAFNQIIPLWVKRNNDFVQSLLTIHSVKMQINKEDQERIMDKALNTILEKTYIKMKHFSHELTTPVLLLHTFGMMLPLIGLIAFPMMSVFMADSIKMSYLFFGYIIVLPALLLFFTRRIISRRPGAFTVPDISKNPYLPPKGKYLVTYKNKQYFIPVLPVALVTGLLIMLPGIIRMLAVTIPVMYQSALTNTIPAVEYSLSAMFVTVTIPVGLGIGAAIYFYGQSAQRLKVRNSIVEIDEDLGDSLFKLSNQFSENIPLEIAVENFIKEYEMLKQEKRSIFRFFSDMYNRMQDEGISFEKAAFDKRRGLLLLYPSILLKEIIWIISEGAKKGAITLHKITIKISAYLENTKKIKELIYDLLTETSNSINIQAKFFSPFLAGLVGSLTLIIVKTLYQMSEKLGDIMKLISTGSVVKDNFFLDFINFAEITPPTVFQVLVGIYMVETVILLSMLSNGVQSGFDKTSRNMTISKNLTFSIIVYFLITVIGAFALNLLVARGAAAANFQ